MPSTPNSNPGLRAAQQKVGVGPAKAVPSRALLAKRKKKKKVTKK